MEIVITQQNGWKKPVTIGNSIVRIGSDPSNTIQIESERIAPVHLQVFHQPDNFSACRVLNLASPVILHSGGASAPLLPFKTQDVRDGDEIEVGEYRLAFKLAASTGSVVRSSRVIEASLTLAEAVLRPQIPTSGVITIKNSGARDACQFQIALKGLTPDCYQIDPVPLMYPGSQEEIRIRLFHKITFPDAGYLLLAFVISAPDSYPGEELLIQQKIYVEPVLDQILEIMPEGKTAQHVQEETPVTPSMVTPKNESTAPTIDRRLDNVAQPAPVILTPPPLQPVQDFEKTIAPAEKPVKPAVASVPVNNLPKLKVVHGQSDEFWDE